MKSKYSIRKITKYTKLDLDNLAKKHNSKCLSPSYHTEEKCRFIFEALTKEKFPKIRIPVKNETLFKRMELDGYSKKLNLAFEHNGVQHYQFVKRFHQIVDNFYHFQKKDQRKKEICKAMDIKLIIIPHKVSQLGEKDLSQFISHQLTLNFIPIIGTVKFENFYLQSPLEKLQQFAKTRNGKCLGSTYEGPHCKIKWECQEGHNWLATPASVKNSGRWCPVCSKKRVGMKKRKYSIEYMRKIAESHGGVCLSDTYNSTHNKMKWKCSRGHVWQAIAMSAIKGHWCKRCRKFA